VRIAVIGGGPAGLYFSILYKKARPDAEIDVYEKNPEGVTWGWGVVFSEETMGNFREADRESFDQISASFARWTEIDVHFKGRTITSGGHDFAGLYRVVLLDILTARARELGVRVHFDEDIDFSKPDTPKRFADCDLLVGADGINSTLRTRYADRFRPSSQKGAAKFIWLGSDKQWDTFTFIVRRNEHGLFQVHAYQFDENLSTFIVECDESSWRSAGLDEASEAESIAYCEKLFAPELGDAKLEGNRSMWINFNRIKNEHWFFHDDSGEGAKNVVI
jgi:anthraniloyl-CoA monooxygenase